MVDSWRILPQLCCSTTACDFLTVFDEVAPQKANNKRREETTEQVAKSNQENQEPQTSS